MREGVLYFYTIKLISKVYKQDNEGGMEGRRQNIHIHTYTYTEKERERE